MIEQGDTYTFCFNNAQRDFKPREEEIYLLQCEIDETEWHYLRDFPTDAIGALRLVFDDIPGSVTVGFEAFRRVHRTPQAGEMFLIELKLITQADWLRFSPEYRFRLGEASISWTSRAEKRKRQSKAKEPTPYGAFWQQMDKAGFHNRPDVRRWIGYSGLDERDAKQCLRRIFNAQSRATDISPDDLREWAARMPDNDGVLTMIETLRFGQHNG